MPRTDSFFIGGAWTAPGGREAIDIVDPATEEAIGRLAMGAAADVDAAVAAAAAAFPAWSRSTREDRLALLRAIEAEYARRADDLALAVHREMGAPLPFAKAAQVPLAGAHIGTMIEVLEGFAFAEDRGGISVRKEPAGVVAMITPWNWPLNQIACKVLPALAAGCTMVLKPSEIAPLSGIVFAEVLEAAGVPPGVFNLVSGDGPTVGAAMAAHPRVDMVSFTGSTRAGVAVAHAAADTVKRVHQELGGKSPNVILPDADLSAAVPAGVAGCFVNAGQSCNAPTRMLVQRERHCEAARMAGEAARGFVPAVADGDGNERELGPMVSPAQFDKVQELIQAGIDEGATLVTGGTGRPEGVGRGWFVRPTVFADVTPDMRVAQEEIFGPVLSIMPCDTVDDAIAMANDTEYGLAAYVSGRDAAQVGRVADAMRAGTVFLNDAGWTPRMPFGGDKRSGNGREYAEFGLNDYLEVKGVVGRAA